jgi:hypothetical protein
VDLGPVLRAHSYLRVERPSELWPLEVDDVVLIRLLGETIAFALGRGTQLGDVLLRANNVTVEHDDAPIAAGDHVTLTIGGAGDWSPEVSWRPDDPEAPILVNDDVTAAARAAGVRWAYTRAFGDHGSVTVFFPRAAE